MPNALAASLSAHILLQKQFRITLGEICPGAESQREARHHLSSTNAIQVAAGLWAGALQMGEFCPLSGSDFPHQSYRVSQLDLVSHEHWDENWFRNGNFQLQNIHFGSKCSGLH